MLNGHNKVNNPAASNGASKLNAAEQQTVQRTGRLVLDPRGTRQMSPSEPLGSLLAGIKGESICSLKASGKKRKASLSRAMT